MSNLKRIKYRLRKAYYENVGYSVHKQVMKVQNLKNKLSPAYHRNVEEGNAQLKKMLIGTKKKIKR